MSNYLAIATVTAVLRQALQEALDAARPHVTSAQVTTTRPNAAAADLPNPGVNIFLYQVTPSAALRNQDLPRRRSDGTLSQRPQAAMDLHYLLTFHGADAQLDPQIVHGVVTRALHEQPVLTRAAIQHAVADARYAFLADSDLADAVELTRLSPVALSVEEMAKLWSIFYQIPYVLSTAYRASVVLIDSDIIAQSAPPVRTTRVHTLASPGPRIDSVAAASATAGSGRAAGRIVAGDDLVLLGEHLRAPVTAVRFGDLEVTPPPAAVSDRRIQLPVPAQLAAGAQGVQVVHRAADRATPEAASSVAPFVLLPTITARASDRTLAVSVAPAVRADQRVVVLLNELGAPAERAARTYALPLPPPASSGPDPTSTLEVAVPDVAPGRYLIRLQVDGAESPLGYDEQAGAYTAPQVTIA